MAGKLNFARFLVDNQVVSAEAMKGVQEDVKTHRQSLYHLLVQKGLLNEDRLAESLAKFHQVPFQAGPLPVVPDLISEFPIFTLRRYQVIPLARDSHSITLATANPGNFQATDAIHRMTGLVVHLVCAPESAILEAIDTLPQSGGENRVVAPSEVVSGTTITHIDKIIERSVHRGASDVHFEPQSGFALIRERIDGILTEVERVDPVSFSPMLSRLKLLAGMDIVEKRLAQDGRFKFRYPNGQCEIRGSTLPTIYGEKMVLRLLRPSKKDPSLDSLEIGPERMEGVRRVCKLNDGLVLVAGPTGCGKTTTIYALLSTLDRRSQNLIMIEDPVEYELEFASQVQINPRLGVTFASMLPNILRQDPDILMVGEVREEATAQMVIRAAISGHLVFSSIHAPGAVETVVRLMDMEIQPHLVVAALKAAISQRLLRRLCPRCKKAREAKSDEKSALGVNPSKSLTLYDPIGCEGCVSLGYAGRFAVMEILLMGDALRDAILKRDHRRFEEAAKQSGFKTLREHAVERVLAGETTLVELEANCS